LDDLLDSTLIMKIADKSLRFSLTRSVENPESLHVGLDDFLERPALFLGARRVVKRHMCITEYKRVILVCRPLHEQNEISSETFCAGSNLARFRKDPVVLSTRTSLP
jgi:hypothetical protein